MADHCSFCDTRRPNGGTKILVLNQEWLEFCEPCGQEVILTNAVTGEDKCIADVFAMTEEMKGGADVVVQ